MANTADSPDANYLKVKIHMPDVGTMESELKWITANASRCVCNIQYRDG